GELGDRDVAIYDARYPFAYYALDNPRWVDPFDQGLALPAALDSILARKQQVWLVHWLNSVADAQGYLTWYLDGQHRLVEQRELRGFELRRYALDPEALRRTVAWQPEAASFEGGLSLLNWGTLRPAPAGRAAAQIGRAHV